MSGAVDRIAQVVKERDQLLGEVRKLTNERNTIEAAFAPHYDADAGIESPVAVLNFLGCSLESTGVAQLQAERNGLLERVQEAEAQLEKLQADYLLVADAVATSSTSAENLATKARETRARAEKLGMAIGLATTLSPQTVMNADDPLAVMQEIVAFVEASRPAWTCAFCHTVMEMPSQFSEHMRACDAHPYRLVAAALDALLNHSLILELCDGNCRPYAKPGGEHTADCVVAHAAAVLR